MCLTPRRRWNWPVLKGLRTNWPKNSCRPLRSTKPCWLCTLTRWSPSLFCTICFLLDFSWWMWPLTSLLLPLRPISAIRCGKPADPESREPQTGSDQGGPALPRKTAQQSHRALTGTLPSWLFHFCYLRHSVIVSVSSAAVFRSAPRKRFWNQTHHGTALRYARYEYKPNTHFYREKTERTRIVEI